MRIKLSFTKIYVGSQRLVLLVCRLQTSYWLVTLVHMIVGLKLSLQAYTGLDAFMCTSIFLRSLLLHAMCFVGLSLA